MYQNMYSGPTSQEAHPGKASPVKIFDLQDVETEILSGRLTPADLGPHSY